MPSTEILLIEDSNQTLVNRVKVWGSVESEESVQIAVKTITRANVAFVETLDITLFLKCEVARCPIFDCHLLQFDGVGFPNYTVRDGRIIEEVLDEISIRRYGRCIRHQT